MMNLYLDTEFNGFNGELISLALVGEREWYGVMKIPVDPHPFVKDHVIPVLYGTPLGREIFLKELHEFLLPIKNPTIIADWPEDFAYFCKMLCGPDGWQLKFTCRMELIDSGQIFPEIPHNALSDARALRDWHQRMAA